MKKIITIFAALCVLTAFSACDIIKDGRKEQGEDVINGENTPVIDDVNENKNENEIENEIENTQTDPDTEKNDIDENVDEPPEDFVYDMNIDSEEDALKYLSGHWTMDYRNFYSYASVLELDIFENGTFELMCEAYPFMYTESDEETLSVFNYRGQCELEKIPDCEFPYAVKFVLDTTDDEYFYEWDRIGDFSIDEFTQCDGDLFVRFTQLNNGDSFLSRYAGDPSSLIFVKHNGIESQSEPRANAEFYAYLPKSRYGGYEDRQEMDGFFVFADDVEIVDSYNIVNKVRESVRYRVSDTSDDPSISILSGGWDGIMPYSDCVYKITTDENAEIVSAVFVPTEEPPTQEWALGLLEQCDEFNMMIEDGYEIMYEGVGTLYDRYVQYVTLGTMHDDSFVREVRYAVTSDDDIYRYSVIEDDWYWIDPEAKG